MKIALAIALTTTLLAAQDPPKAEPKPPVSTGTPAPGAGQPAKQEPAKQEPAKQEPAKQDPAKQEPAKQDPAKQEPAKQEPGPDNGGPVPAGADPADLRAIRSAEAMIEAERNLQKLIKEGKFKGLDKVLPFDELTSWPYEDGLKGMPKRIKELDGKKVLMTGFMLPIDEVQNIKEFLLVQSLWSCCYGSPPDINGIVRVVMPKGKTTDYYFDPMKVIGKFKVEATLIEGYCVDIYQIEVESLEPIKTGN